ncbi:prefoldin subunit 1-like [Babylonia areolata]|uniref:prefoldin subunit 1-like n=1 Tax=Babylonia areolata TaxID=304850 RepID=UPI003FD2FED9
MASIPVDMELKKAFQELQLKMIQTTQQLKVADNQVETLKRKIQHTRLVDQEICALPDDTPVYQGVGRMFLLMSVPTIRDSLSKKQKLADEKIKTIEVSKEYLEKSLKESENSLRELVLSKQQQR